MQDVFQQPKLSINKTRHCYYFYANNKLDFDYPDFSPYQKDMQPEFLINRVCIQYKRFLELSNQMKPVFPFNQSL